MRAAEGIECRQFFTPFGDLDVPKGFVKNGDTIVWNDSAADLWGLRSDEVKGKHFLNLDIGLPVAELKPLLRACIAGESEPAEIDLPAMNRRGKKLLIRVRCTPLLGDKKSTT